MIENDLAGAVGLRNRCEDGARVDLTGRLRVCDVANTDARDLFAEATIEGDVTD